MLMCDTVLWTGICDNSCLVERYGLRLLIGKRARPSRDEHVVQHFVTFWVLESVEEVALLMLNRWFSPSVSRPIFQIGTAASRNDENIEYSRDENGRMFVGEAFLHTWMDGCVVDNLLDKRKGMDEIYVLI